MNPNTTHRAWHPGEDDDYLTAAIDRVRERCSMSDAPRRTWVHDLEDHDYHVDINIGLMDRAERQEYYGLLYQATGELSTFMPNPYPYLPHNNDPTDFPQDCPGEWHAYNAAYHAVLTAMDALAALVDIVDGDEA